MKVISVEKAEKQLGEILSMAETNPIAIQESNGRTTVFLSMKQYEFFEQLEDMCRTMRADEDSDIREFGQKITSVYAALAKKQRPLGREFETVLNANVRRLYKS